MDLGLSIKKYIIIIIITKPMPLHLPSFIKNADDRKHDHDAYIINKHINVHTYSNCYTILYQYYFNAN